MQIENLGDASRERVFHAHLGMTQAALIQVFDKSEQEAARTVRELWSKFENAPRQEQDLLLHNDPVALACDLAGQQWSNVSEAKLAEFNKAREKKMQSWDTGEL